MGKQGLKVMQKGKYTLSIFREFSWESTEFNDNYII